jgi:hypothetical protein
VERQIASICAVQQTSEQVVCPIRLKSAEQERKGEWFKNAKPLAFINTETSPRFQTSLSIKMRALFNSSGQELLTTPKRAVSNLVRAKAAHYRIAQ